MTPADLALSAALSFEAKKDSMRQTQSGTWKVTFTVQATDVPRSLTEAMPGARYQVVIVEIGDNELPVSGAAAPAASRSMANGKRAEQGNQGGAHALTSNVSHKPDREALRDEPEPVRPRRDWRDVSPTEQACIRCGEPEFAAFLREERQDDWHEAMSDTAECIRLICGVASRKQLNVEHRARVIWHQLDEQFLTWKALERAS